jgi:hypothetical protein
MVLIAGSFASSTRILRPPILVLYSRSTAAGASSQSARSRSRRHAVADAVGVPRQDDHRDLQPECRERTDHVVLGRREREVADEKRGVPSLVHGQCGPLVVMVRSYGSAR